MPAWAHEMAHFLWLGPCAPMVVLQKPSRRLPVTDFSVPSADAIPQRVMVRVIAARAVNRLRMISSEWNLDDSIIAQMEEIENRLWVNADRGAARAMALPVRPGHCAIARRYSHGRALPAAADAAPGSRATRG